VKVLIANNFYYLRGGACTYMFALTNLLEAKGHQIAPFAMHHPKNFNSSYSKYFVSYIDYVESLRDFSLTTGLKAASRAVYSREAKKKMEGLISDFEPDIAHLQNIHNHLTPSILYPLKENNIPVIWTLHDYKLICPNTSFLRDGKICERCKKMRFYNAPITKCKKGSIMASLLACTESYIHQLLRIQKYVDVFVAPSSFLKNKMIEYGFDENRIVAMPNFISQDEDSSSADVGDYIMYSGRLSPEKGVDLLIEAARGIRGAHFIIAGDGPQREELERKAADVTSSRIDFVGHQPQEKIRKLTRAARFAVLPSKWYENCPYAILETFSLGKPVIGARIGGIPELINDGTNGLLFELDNVADLIEKIQCLLKDDSLVEGMGNKAREKANTEYSPDAYYENIMSVYKLALD
jgi:glycosyltransferase involved in cell wall biosynthesis